MSEMLASLEHLVRNHPAGTVLFREGDRGATMYVMRSGKVKIWKHISDTELTLAVLGPGEFFGEMALLEGLPRSAGAALGEDAAPLELGHEPVATLVRQHRGNAGALMRPVSSPPRAADPPHPSRA